MLLIPVICYDERWSFVPLRRPSGCKMAYLQQGRCTAASAQGRHEAARAVLEDSASQPLWLFALKPDLSFQTLISLCGEKGDPYLW